MKRNEKKEDFVHCSDKQVNATCDMQSVAQDTHTHTMTREDKRVQGIQARHVGWDTHTHTQTGRQAGRQGPAAMLSLGVQ